MPAIFSLKELNDNPADGISNANRAIFGRLDAKENLRFFAFCPAGFVDRGAIKKIDEKYNSAPGKLRFLWREKPDYLLGIGHPREIFYFLLKPRRTKYVIAWHTVLFKNGEVWDVKTPWFLRRFIINRSEFIVTVSNFAAESIRRYFPHKKVFGVLNGTDLEMFNPKNRDRNYLAKEYSIDFSKPVIAFVGALQSRKRPDVFAVIARKNPVFNFVMVGRLAEPWPFLDDANKPANLHWISRMPPKEDVGRFLASSDVFVFPSVNEAAAAVIIEAMASGCVPVVSRSGGNPEFFVEGESGFSIPVGENEIAEFSKKTKELVGDQEKLRAMSLATRKEAEKHSWQVVAERYKGIFI